MTQKNGYNLGGVLYLIGKGGKKGFPFRIRLQKLVLLGKIEDSFPFSFEYESHYYGPYSVQLQSILVDMVTDGLINENVIATGEENSGFIYSITEKGQLKLANLSLSETETKKLDNLWIRYMNKSTDYIIKKAKEISGIKSISDK